MRFYAYWNILLFIFGLKFCVVSHVKDLNKNTELQIQLTKIYENLDKTEVGKPVVTTLKNISIEFNPKLFRKYVARNITENGLSRIEINPKLWNNYSNLRKEFLILHEGSHAKFSKEGSLIDDELSAYQNELVYALEKSIKDIDMNNRL
ncbi:MAG: hypothetical protein KC646_03710 [Candidatus Cloacimonetes bacterium]|nr:hypothetical protein [Candidatus Cloacimonadota bacterium]